MKSVCVQEDLEEITRKTQRAPMVLNDSDMVLVIVLSLISHTSSFDLIEPLQVTNKTRGIVEATVEPCIYLLIR